MSAGGLGHVSANDFIHCEEKTNSKSLITTYPVQNLLKYITLTVKGVRFLPDVRNLTIIETFLQYVI